MDTDTSTGNVTTTLYIGSVEKISKSDGARQIKRYIGGYAVITENYNSGGTLTGTDNHYLLKDHLGSTSLVTDENGAIVQQMDFDPWGQRRDPDSWAQISLTDLQNNFFHNLAATGQPYTTRGFTGHEMVDEVGIIHMNGRIYDPQLGRFLQADPFVQDPTHTQSLNRYSYVLNNPLNAIDPDGFFFKKLRRIVDIIVVVVSIVIEIVCEGCGAGMQLMNAYFNKVRPALNSLVAAEAAYNSGNYLSAAASAASLFRGGICNGGGALDCSKEGGFSEVLAPIGDSALRAAKNDEATIKKVSEGTYSDIDNKFANSAGQGRAFLEAVGADKHVEEDASEEQKTLPNIFNDRKFRRVLGSALNRARSQVAGEEEYAGDRQPLGVVIKGNGEAGYSYTPRIPRNIVVGGYEPSTGFVGGKKPIENASAVAISEITDFRAGHIPSVTDYYNWLARQVGAPVVVTGARLSDYYVFTGSDSSLVVDPKTWEVK